MDSSKVPTLSELKSRRRPLRNINIEHHERLTRLEKLALFITKHVGTMGFFLLVLFWTIVWLGWNVLGPKALRFDPFPAFALWLFISNMIQLFLLPLLMVGQNLQGRHAEARAETDLEVNRRAEQEIEAVLSRLEKQGELLERISQKLDQKQ